MCLLTLLGGVSQPANSLVCWLAGGLSRGPGGVCRVANSCVDRLVASSGPHPPGISVYLPLEVEIIAESVAQTALGMGICALAPRPVRGSVSYGAIVVTKSRFPSARVRPHRSHLSYCMLLESASALVLLVLALAFAGRHAARRARSRAHWFRFRSLGC